MGATRQASAHKAASRALSDVPNVTAASVAACEGQAWRSAEQPGAAGLIPDIQTGSLAPRPGPVAPSSCSRRKTPVPSSPSSSSSSSAWPSFTPPSLLSVNVTTYGFVYSLSQISSSFSMIHSSRSHSSLSGPFPHCRPLTFDIKTCFIPFFFLLLNHFCDVFLLLILLYEVLNDVVLIRFGLSVQYISFYIYTDKEIRLRLESHRSEENTYKGKEKIFRGLNP